MMEKALSPPRIIASTIGSDGERPDDSNFPGIIAALVKPINTREPSLVSTFRYCHLLA